VGARGVGETGERALCVFVDRACSLLSSPHSPSDASMCLMVLLTQAASWSTTNSKPSEEMRRTGGWGEGSGSPIHAYVLLRA
jgi:hypothetical protein